VDGVALGLSSVAGTGERDRAGSGITGDMTDDPRWQAVLAREDRDDFVYAVRTTRVYCRPSCPSRRPRPDNVAFFPHGADAEDQGYRACRRCRPDAPAADERVARVEAACRLLDTDGARVGDVARALGVTADGLRRDFQRVLGVAPKHYADARRVDRLRAELRDGRDVTGALYSAGYGSSSRLYEQSDARLGMTPASYGAGGAGATIAFATAPSPLGMVIVATTDRGVCWIALGAEADALEAGLREHFPAATAIERDDAVLAPVVAEVLRRTAGEQARTDVPLDVRGTAFQVRVWQELQRIPRGETRSYGEVAAAVGVPGGARAVGAACGSNPVSVVVPCHRVVTAGGGLGGYAWGLDAKQALLERERAGGSS
jgi:AraC family transcriptional regulator of adaptative response/methylated-DNA-[protein]-cysteine methyltransferase